MFRAWTFTEMPYPYLPPADSYGSLRVTLPSQIYDPELGHQLYAKYFDLYQAADGLGLDMMLNEHHSTATCVEPAVPVTMAVLARITSRGRILALGNPIANRNTPVRVAEEMAMIDVISHGRTEVGFVRGVPYEVSACNVNPVDMKGRFWEGADLIVRAWSTTDGPFNWEGRYYHHRQVNVWPRPYQEPHPPLWVPTQSSSTVAETADRQYKLGLILCGWQGARRLFDLYRKRTAELGLGPASLDKLGYLGLVYVGDTDEEGYAGARKLQWYVQHNKVATQFMDVPGYIDENTRAKMMRSSAGGVPVSTPIEHLAYAPIEELVRDGYFFAGNPDTVFAQLKSFYEKVGGFGNFMMMVQGGTMGYDLVEGSMRRFARDVLPRFRSDVYGQDIEPLLAAAS